MGKGTRKKERNIIEAEKRRAEDERRLKKKKRARINFFGAFDKHIIIKFYILHVIYILRVNQYFLFQ